MKYDVDTNSSRGIALWRLDEKTNLGPFKALEGRAQKTADGADTLYFLKVADDKGAEFEICHRARDIKRCIREWGLDSDSWGMVVIERIPSTTRGVLVPAGKQPILETAIQE